MNRRKRKNNQKEIFSKYAKQLNEDIESAICTDFARFTLRKALMV